MQKVLVDSNIILDIVEFDPVWSAWSTNALATCAEDLALIINPVIYAEVSVGFASIEEMSEAVPQSGFEYEPLPWVSRFSGWQMFFAIPEKWWIKTIPLA